MQCLLSLNYAISLNSMKCAFVIELCNVLLSLNYAISLNSMKCAFVIELCNVLLSMNYMYYNYVLLSLNDTMSFRH